MPSPALKPTVILPWRAAAALGDDATVADVIAMLKAAGLQPPQQDPKLAAIELERARRVLGMS